MVDAVSIQPVILSGLAGVPPVVFERLATGSEVSAAALAALSGTSSSVVALSSTGLLLSAVASFRVDLASVQALLSENRPAAIADTVAGLVGAFNRLQGHANRLQSVTGALADATLASQFAQGSNDFVSTSLTIEGDSLAALQSIGFALVSTPTSTGSTLSLNLDAAALATAIRADPGRTRAVLAGAAQSLSELAVDVETRLANATIALGKLTPLAVTVVPQVSLNTLLGLPADTSAPDITVPTDLLHNLNADTVLNAIGLADLDLEAAGLDADALSLEDSVLRGALANALRTSDNLPTSTETPEATLSLLREETLAAAAPVTTPPAIAASAPPVAAPAITAAPAIPLAPAAATSIAAFPVATTTLANATQMAERQASAAALALQNLLANPSLRARNNAFDPAYAAMIAATHLSDFVSPVPTNYAAALAANAIPAVSPITAARAIGYYKAAAAAVAPQLARRT